MAKSDESSLRERLTRTFHAIGCTRGAGELAATVVAAWAEPHRRYHDLAHLRTCLALLDELREHARAPNEIEVALAFHDAIYDPRAKDNEERSAEWARRDLCAGGASTAAGDRVAALVLATRHDAEIDPERDPDAALLVDIDLAILGAPEREYDAFERAIREEYAFVPDDLFALGRAAILQSFLLRTSIYATAPVRARLEPLARHNLARAVERLTGGVAD